MSRPKTGPCAFPRNRRSRSARSTTTSPFSRQPAFFDAARFPGKACVPGKIRWHGAALAGIHRETAGIAGEALRRKGLSGSGGAGGRRAGRAARQEQVARQYPKAGETDRGQREKSWKFNNCAAARWEADRDEAGSLPTCEKSRKNKAAGQTARTVLIVKVGSRPLGGRPRSGGLGPYDPAALVYGPSAAGS